ncbi:MAG: cysteine protease StiP family protein [Oscillospiraceae bacterium]|nr:cysteine protease StiP family protein [Oscillospiraceae bacterium]
MFSENKSSFRSEDVTLLLTDITGLIEPKPTEEREKLIQSGVHYSEMLPLEYKPTERYIEEYYRALDSFALETAAATAAVSEKIYTEKRGRAVLVSLARAGTPAGILIKRYIKQKYGVNMPHYTISIARGRGIDGAAMRYILSKHPAQELQFVDGWTGKGAILDELYSSVLEFIGEQNKRMLLAVMADPANVTDMRGTCADIPIASSFLNATVCGLMSRTVIRPGIKDDEFHGVAFYENLKEEDRTYEFINRLEACFNILENERAISNVNLDKPAPTLSGACEARKIAREFNIGDINFIKPGIGEATRVLLRRIPDMVLVAQGAEEKYIAHIVQLAKEKNVPVIHYPLQCYKACGIIKALSPDL